MNRMKISRKKLIAQLEKKQEAIAGNIRHLSGVKAANEEHARCILETKSYEGGQYKAIMDVLNVLKGFTTEVA